MPCEDTCCGRISGLSASPYPGSDVWILDLPSQKQIYFLEAQEMASLIVSRGGATRGASRRKRDEHLSPCRLAGRCSTILPPGTIFGGIKHTKRNMVLRTGRCHVCALGKKTQRRGKRRGDSGEATHVEQGKFPLPHPTPEQHSSFQQGAHVSSPVTD